MEDNTSDQTFHTSLKSKLIPPPPPIDDALTQASTSSPPPYDDSSNNETSEIYPSKSSKAKLYFYTGLIFFSYTIYGIAYNIWGPSWMDLIQMLQSTQDQMSYGNSLMAIGYIFGSFSSTYVFERFDRQFCIAIYLLAIAASICLTPLLGNYYVFLGMAVLFGIGEGGFDTGTNAWLLEMWLDENGPLMQSMYFFYGLGTFLSPLICLHFLSDNNFVDSNYQLLSSYRNATIPDSIEASLNINITQNGQRAPHHSNYFFPMLKRQFVLGDDFVQSSSIEIPYFIISALLVFTSLIHILCSCFVRYEADEAATILRLKNPLHNLDKEPSEKSKCINQEKPHSSSYGLVELENSSEHRQLDKQSRRKIVTLVCIGAGMSCFYDGMENISFEYMTSFLVNTPLTISEADAAKLVSAMSAAYTVARGLGIVIIMKVRPKFLLVIDAILIFMGLNLLYFNMDTSESGILAGLLMLGLGTSTFMPCMFSYFEEHIRLTNSLCAILSLSCALVSTIDPIIVGHLINSLPSIVLYINYASLVVVAIAFALFEIVAMCSL